MILSVQLAVLPAQAAESSCRALFGSDAAGETSARRPRFDHELFNREKQRFDAEPESWLKPDDRPETILAWIEARSAKSGFSYRLSSDPAVLEKRAAAWKKALVSQKMFSGDFKSSGARVRAALMMIHGELHHLGWKDLPKSFLPNAQTAIAERVQSEILANEVVEAFRKSGFIIDPLHAERFSHRLYASGGWNWALQLSFSAFSPLWTKALIPPGFGGGGFFIPPLISGAKFEYLRKLPPELEAKIRDQGYGAAKDDLMRHFGVPAHASWLVNSATRVFIYAITLLLLQDVVEYYPWAWGFFKSIFESDESFRQARVEMGADAIREQLVGSWQEWYEATYHRPPQPQELEQARARMRAIPDEKLLGSPAAGGDKTASGNEKS